MDNSQGLETAVEEREGVMYLRLTLRIGKAWDAVLMPLDKLNGESYCRCLLQLALSQIALIEKRKVSST